MIRKSSLGKPVAYSAINEQVHTVFPNELNPRGKMFGGVPYSLADILAQDVFRRHTEGMWGITLGHDKGRYINPAGEGDTLVLRAAMNRAWRTSCEIGIKVFRLDYQDGRTLYIPVTRGYFTYVSDEFDEQGKRKQIPPVIPQTPEEKRRYREAGLRRAISILVDAVPPEKKEEAIQAQVEALKNFFSENDLAIPPAALESL